MPFFIGGIMENESMFVNFCWFVAGAFLYKISSQVLSLNNAKVLYIETIIACLQLSQATDESYQSICQLRYEAQKLKNNEQELESQKQLDQNFQKFWRQVFINTILTFCPKELKGLLNFKDWDSAMKLLNKQGVPSNGHKER